MMTQVTPIVKKKKKRYTFNKVEIFKKTNSKDWTSTNDTKECHKFLKVEN